MSSEIADSETILEVNDVTDPSLIVAAPPEDLSDDEIFDKTTKIYRKINENTSAGRLQMRVPDAPDNLIELVFRKKCVECSAILTTISSALMHYNSVKHQNKIALKFLPHGTYNLPLSKEEIREIETGVSKTGDPNQPAPVKVAKMPFRDLVKKFDIVENVRHLDLEFCRICETPFSSKVAALQHYSGKKHKKNAENWSSYNPIKPIDTKEDLKCDACNVIVESSIHMEMHIAGKKHQIKMKAYLERVNAGVIAPPMSSRGFCDFNNVEREEANPVDPSRYIQENILPKNLTGSFINSFPSEEPQPYQGGIFASDFGYEYGAMNMGFEQHFMEDFKPRPPLDFMNDFQPDISRGFGRMPDDTSFLFMDNKIPNPPWSNSLSRSQMDAPYAPNFARVPTKFPVPSFGPTKFRYSRKQPL